MFNVSHGGRDNKRYQAFQKNSEDKRSSKSGTKLQFLIQKEQFVSNPKNKLLLAYKERVLAYCENHSKHNAMSPTVTADWYI